MAPSLTTPSTPVHIPDPGEIYVIRIPVDSCDGIYVSYLLSFNFSVSFLTFVRLRDKSPRSEDLEADDEQGDKTDNDHDRLDFLSYLFPWIFLLIMKTFFENESCHRELKPLFVLQSESF